jgi:hypothetical protein
MEDFQYARVATASLSIERKESAASSPRCLLSQSMLTSFARPLHMAEGRRVRKEAHGRGETSVLKVAVTHERCRFPALPPAATCPIA